MFHTVHDILDALTSCGPNDCQPILAAVEVVKKYTYTVGAKLGVLTPYAEPEPADVPVAVPVPLATLDEFRMLIEELKLRMEAALDSDHLARLLHAELCRNRTSGTPPTMLSGASLTWEPTPNEWASLALSMDWALKRLKDRLLERSRKRASTNEERDRHCYEQKKAGKTLKQIQAEVNGHSGWEPLYTEQAVSQAAKRFAERHGHLRPI